MSETEEEEYKKLKEQLSRIPELEKEIEELKTKLEEKANRREVTYLNAWCARCGKKLSQEEIEAESCTACGCTTYNT